MLGHHSRLTLYPDSLGISRPSGADYLGTPTHAVLTLRVCSLITAGYLRKGALYFTRCHLVYFWYRLTNEQRLGFQALYKRGCRCQIQPCLLCWRHCPQPDNQQCVWEQKGCDYKIWEGDQSLYSMCAPRHDGHCGWTRIDTVNYHPETTPPPETTPEMIHII
ncbi:hypothetical protein CapIbe_016151 [Capra ibex]